MRILLTALTLTILPLAAAAQDAALLLGNDRYDSLGRVSGAGNMIEAEDGLQDLGFEVAAVRNGRASQISSELDDFADRAGDADQLVVGLAGRFVTDGTRTWFLLTDAAYPTLFGMDASAVSVDALLTVLGSKPGRAVLVLAGDGGDDDYGPFLREGIGDLAIPQGVTVISGPIRATTAFARGELVDEGADLVEAALDRDLTLAGYLPARLVLVPGEVEAAQPAAPAGPDPAADARGWQVAQRADNAAGYRAYLEAFPNGRNVSEAQDRLEAILAEPNRADRLAEEGLNLTRAERRQIQENLTVLDFNTRGIDGIFGPGTRTAVTNWQQQNGYPQTSYLNREQIARLAGQASRRRSEIAAAERARQEEEARADRAFWDETGARGDAAGYRAYLERFPDGIYSEIAQDNLDAIEEERRAEAAAQDRTAWDRARTADTEAAYVTYLRDFPEGAFRTEAQAALALIREPQGPSEAEVDEARQAERRLQLNPITTRLVEAKLADFGMNPGRVDGDFDQNTRQAIRAYQERRGLPATGYLSEATVVRLLADSINDLQGN